MSTPGSNILARALKIIASQKFQYYAFLSRAAQANGLYLSTYAAPLDIFGSIQAIPRNLYEQMGLEFQRNYKVFYASKNVIDVERDVSGDLIIFGGNTYQCLSISEWFSIDGWDAILCVQIQNIPMVTGLTPPIVKNYITGDHIQFTFIFNAPVVVSDSPYISLSPVAGLIHGNASYLSGSGSASLVFSYTVQSSDTASGISASSPVVGVITNSAGNLNANASFIPPNLNGVTLNA